MKIAVTGAFSYSGKYVAQKLLARWRRSHHIDGTSKSPRSIRWKSQSLSAGLQ